jgi:hypothetical protein
MGAIDDKPSPQPETLAGATNYVVEAIKALNAGKTPAVSSSRPYGCSVKYKS